MYQLVDFQTREQVSTESLVFTGEGRPWEVVMDLSLVRKKINLDYFKKTPSFVSKYLPLLPVMDYGSFVSLGEGETPLIKSNTIAKEFGAKLYFKLEGQNPTGSFKDRGSAVEVTVAKEHGAKGIVVASTGNMAASCSCYAAAARVPCYVFVPEGTPTSKLAQVIAYGGRIVQVRGTYGDAARLAEEVARAYGYYLAGDYAFRIEGSKTAAFELSEQLLYQVPDMVVVPLGCGTNLASYYKGFREYLELGIIDRVPHLIGVQAEAANPIVRAFKKGKREVEPLKEVKSLARAIAINDPLDGMKALEAIYSTQGTCVQVTEEEMVSAQYELSKEEGVFVETACAATVAALRKMQREGHVLSHKHIVCILTGTGLKDPDPIIKAGIQPRSINPTVEEFQELYEKSLKNTPHLHFLQDLEVVFDALPDDSQILKIVEGRLGITLDSVLLSKISERIKHLFASGTAQLLVSDLKDIVTEEFQVADAPDPYLKVKEYSLESGSETKVRARIKFITRGSLDKTSKKVSTGSEAEHEKLVETSGIGMLDALFSAFKEVSPLEGVELDDFSVDVRQVVPNGSVSVAVSLKYGEIRVRARASSYDTIQGTVKALERAFNKLLCR
ncbi:MAG TPA: threonine synthase [Oligoflexia bacterium]|nr:threonine synthase [Oligoflexia bacterium]HMP48527.1 threonine synthase [Oligoflexia bacterium]